MLAIVRRKVTRAEGVQAFHRSNPSNDPGLVVLTTQLDELLVRAKALIQLRSERQSGSKVGTAQSGRLRRRLRKGVLRLFSRAGLAAARQTPALEKAFRPIQPRITKLDFAAAARSMVEAARTHLDALGPHGVTAALVEEGSALLEQYVVTTEAALGARGDRVKAGAELQVVAGELMDVVRRIDALNQHRFADTPDLLAAWNSAKDVNGPIFSRNGKNGPATGGTTPGVTPPSGTDGDVRQAA